MVGKKSLVFMTSLALAASIFSGCSASQNSTSLKNKKVIKIGITQIIEHPALDSAHKGFTDALKAKGFEEGKNLKIDFQNAQGDMPTAQSIAQNFVTQKEDMILAISTTSAQAAYNATKDIPIIITAVTDPVQAGLAKSLDKPDTNVTGTSDNVPIDKQFELLKKLVPNAKKVGILYNTSESNSDVQVKAAKNASSKFGLEIVTAGITSVNDVSQSLNSLVDKIDVLYVPTDNMVVSSMPLISSICFKKNKPIIGAEKGTVSSGAVACLGIDYYKLGYQTGLTAVSIINGAKPQSTAITTLKDMQLTINTDAVKKLNMTIPSDLESSAEKITGGVK